MRQEIVVFKTNAVHQADRALKSSYGPDELLEKTLDEVVRLGWRVVHMSAHLAAGGGFGVAVIVEKDDETYRG